MIGDISSSNDDARGGWTRELIQDLFPRKTSPLAWSLLRQPFEGAIDRIWADLKVVAPAQGEYLRREPDGLVELNADRLVEASQSIGDTIWLVGSRPQSAKGIVSRLRLRPMAQRFRVEVAAALAAVPRQRDELGSWLHWVHGLAWSQADLLQVMEELEPRVCDVLRTYLLLRGALRATHAGIESTLPGALAPAESVEILGLYAGLDGMPSVDAAYAWQRPSGSLGPTPSQREDFVGRYGHRGPQETGLAAARWWDGDLLSRMSCAEVGDAAAAAKTRANTQREATEKSISARVGAEKWQQLQPKIAHARDLCRATDQVWDTLIQAIAAAQLWANAIAAEAQSAGLIVESGDVMLLEIEELKRIATGEWHEGYAEEVRERLVSRRRDAMPSLPNPALTHLVGLCPGSGQGRVWNGDCTGTGPMQGSVLVTEQIDAGCGPWWLGCMAIAAEGRDRWSPGVVAARCLGIPTVGGISWHHETLRPETTVTVDGTQGSVVSSNT